jgi:hypothetical protein
MLPTKLLVIEAKDFKLIKEKNEPEKKRTLEFILKSFPDLDTVNKNSTMEEYIYLVEKKTFDLGSIILEEGVKGEVFYLLYHGSIEISKSVYVKENPKSLKFKEINAHMRLKTTYREELIVSTISLPGTFVGEEVLFMKDSKYSFTCKVSSPNTVLFAIKKGIFLKKALPSSKVIMEKVYHQKNIERAETIKRKIERKYIESKFSSVFEQNEAFLESYPGSTFVHGTISVEYDGESSIKSKLKVKSLGGQELSAKKAELKENPVHIQFRTKSMANIDAVDVVE